MKIYGNIYGNIYIWEYVWEYMGIYMGIYTVGYDNYDILGIQAIRHRCSFEPPGWIFPYWGMGIITFHTD